MRIAVLLLAVFATGACRGDGVPSPPEDRLLYLVPAGPGFDRPEVPSGAAVARVEVAETVPSRQQGLMWRERLEPDHGMLFIYPSERPLEFWMKNTRIPLSICYARESGRIVAILEMEIGVGVPESGLPLYPSGEPALYALEMERGWFRKRGILVGDRIRLHPQLVTIRAE